LLNTLGSRRAVIFLSEYVAGKDVLIDYDKRDRYKRILGKVLISGEDINLKQVEDGLAWHYKKYQREQTATDRELYSEAEIAARKAKRGLWRDPNPIPPWEWRKRTR
jgi:endonuclease YncB( thermonuclease family)